MEGHSRRVALAVAEVGRPAPPKVGSPVAHQLRLNGNAGPFLCGLAGCSACPSARSVACYQFSGAPSKRDDCWEGCLGFLAPSDARGACIPSVAFPPFPPSFFLPLLCFFDFLFNRAHRPYSVPTHLAVARLIVAVIYYNRPDNCGYRCRPSRYSIETSRITHVIHFFTRRFQALRQSRLVHSPRERANESRYCSRKSPHCQLPTALRSLQPSRLPSLSLFPHSTVLR